MGPSGSEMGSRPAAGLVRLAAHQRAPDRERALDAAGPFGLRRLRALLLPGPLRSEPLPRARTHLGWPARWTFTLPLERAEPALRWSGTNAELCREHPLGTVSAR